jgi:hypothetical protein
MNDGGMKVPTSPVFVPSYLSAGPVCKFDIFSPVDGYMDMSKPFLAKQEKAIIGNIGCSLDGGSC